MAGDGFYLGLQGGATQLEDQKFRIFDADFGPLILGPDFDDGVQISEIEYDTGYMAGLVFGYAMKNGLRLELDLAHRQNDADGQANFDGSDDDDDGDTSAQTAMANVWFDLFKGSSVHPYIGGGYGAVRVEVDDPSFQTAALNKDEDVVDGYQLGAGIGFDLSPQWTLSLDYRYLEADDATFKVFENSTSRLKADYEAQSAMATLRYYFTAEEPPPPPVEAPPPPPPEVVVATVPADADGDGVTDDLDQCPGTTPGVKVNAVGCPVPLCKSPEPGEVVTLEGCATGDVIVLRGVNFEFDKSRLTANAQQILDGVGDALMRSPSLKIELGGHTDSLGSDGYNLKLSEKRAVSVQKYLVGKGVEPGRMTARGYGETNPVADNGMDDGRELNRRVELKVTEGTARVDSLAPAKAVEAAPPEDVPAVP